MAVKIGHAISTENKDNGKNGKAVAGDQTGREVLVANWYNKPWTYVFRAIDKEAAEKIAVACAQGCANANIGYDQSQRKTLYNEAVKVGFDLSKITAPCECDCSSFVAVCVNAAGIKVSKSMATGNERSLLTATKKFEVFSTDEYKTSPNKLKRGDILLGVGHTAIVLTNGPHADLDDKKEEEKKEEDAQTDTSIKGLWRASGNYNLRKTPGKTDKPKGDIICIVRKGKTVEALGTYEVVDDRRWFLVNYKGKTGYISEIGLKKA